MLRVETLDGIKRSSSSRNLGVAGRGRESGANAAETWLLLRASGTEPLLRVYCESCSMQSVTAVLEAARQFVLAGRNA